MLNLISGFAGALTVKSSTTVTIHFTLSVCLYACNNGRTNKPDFYKF